MLELVLSYIYVFIICFLVGWGFLDFTVAIIIRVLAIKNNRFKEMLSEQRKYDMERHTQYLDYKHDRQLLKDIHEEKMTEIIRGKKDDKTEVSRLI